jgi:hypothetical protein
LSAALGKGEVNAPRFDASFVIDHSDVWKGMKLPGKALQAAIQPSN